MLVLKLPMVRVLLPFIAFISTIAFSITIALLPFIPEWAIFQNVTMYFSLLACVAAGMWLVRGIWWQAKESLSTGFLWMLNLGSIFFVGMGLLVTSIFCILGNSNGALRPTYINKFEFPDFRTTIYVYEKTMPDFETVFKIRRGFLPFAESLTEVESEQAGSDPGSFEIVQEGEWAVGNRFRLYLPTGEIKDE